MKFSISSLTFPLRGGFFSRRAAAKSRAGQARQGRTTTAADTTGASSFAKYWSKVRSMSNRALAVGVVFIPGALLLAIALCAILAPRLMLTAIAIFFGFCGVLALVLGYKFLIWRRQLRQLASNFQARIMVQAVQPKDFMQQEEAPDQKKIIFH